MRRVMSGPDKGNAFELVSDSYGAKYIADLVQSNGKEEVVLEGCTSVGSLFSASNEFVNDFYR